VGFPIHPVDWGIFCSLILRSWWCWSECADGFDVGSSGSCNGGICRIGRRSGSEDPESGKEEEKSRRSMVLESHGCVENMDRGVLH
jgi:hypothetical protein